MTDYHLPRKPQSTWGVPSGESDARRAPQGNVQFRVQVDTNAVKRQRQEPTDSRRVVFPGGTSAGTLNMHQDEMMFVRRSGLRRNNGEARCLTALNGAVPENYDSLPRDPYTGEVPEEVLALAMDNEIVMQPGFARLDMLVDSDADVMQGGTAKQQGMLRGHSPLFELPLGSMVRYRTPTQSEGSSPNWICQPGTPPHKRTLVPVPFTPAAAAFELRQTIQMHLPAPRDSKGFLQQDENPLYTKTRSGVERRINPQLDTACAAFTSAQLQGLVMLDRMLRDGWVELADDIGKAIMGFDPVPAAAAAGPAPATGTAAAAAGAPSALAKSLYNTVTAWFGAADTNANYDDKAKREAKQRFPVVVATLMGLLDEHEDTPDQILVNEELRVQIATLQTQFLRSAFTDGETVADFIGTDESDTSNPGVDGNGRVTNNNAGRMIRRQLAWDCGIGSIVAYLQAVGRQLHGTVVKGGRATFHMVE